MTNYFIIALILFLALNVKGQFSGKVIYHDSYKSKNPAISSSDFEKFVGTERVLFMQDSFYKNVHTGEFKSIMLYRGDENKLYRFNEGADTIFWMDALRDTLTKVSESKVERSDEIILGLKCKRIKIVTQLGITTYYFSDSYRIDPRNFKNHHLESWDFYASRARAIPLKIVFESEEMDFVSTAIKVEPIRLNKNIFDVPPGYLKKLF